MNASNGFVRRAVVGTCFEPKTDKKGMRGTLDLNNQILSRLQAMEAEHFRSLDAR